jgi:beta-ribofuranosylaminobenzene 5'-phosphate synthase
MKITTFPRFHITLIGMNAGGYRINGGIGFAVKRPSLEIQINPSTDLYILDSRQYPLSQDALLRLTATINKVIETYKLKKNIALQITGEARTHHGFGTGTAIRLAAIEGLFLINKQRYSLNSIIETSGRGKTSGIGIHTYFKGGLVFDLGHKQNKEIQLPSNQREDLPELPLLLQQINMPQWEIGICIPHSIEAINESDERKLFEETCPVKPDEVYKTLYHATFGLYSAVLENDLDIFCTALISIQSCAWKSAERGLYGKKLLDIETSLYKCGASAVGLSSVGPSLFFFAKDMDKTQKKMKEKYIGCELISTYPCNSGRIIEDD